MEARGAADARDVNATTIASAGAGAMAIEYLNAVHPSGVAQADGRPYLCPQSCFLMGAKLDEHGRPKFGPLHSARANATHMLGYTWPVVMRHKEMRCPWW